ncbi:MAG TPA: DUF4382 domain-containing protein [Candidatus Paceibacterota bacterium]
MDNNMNKTLMWIIIAIVVIGLGYYIYRVNVNSGETTDTTETSQSQVMGKVTVAFTDATASIKNVNEISMEVNKVELYSDTQGWVAVGSHQRVYKLLDLNKRSQAEIYTTADVSADTYTRARVTLGNVTVSTKNGDKPATLPGKNLEMETKVVVNENQNASLKLDFVADRSLYLTAKGAYVFAPFIQIEGRSDAQIDMTSEGIVTVSGGSVDTTQNVGMDVDGTVKNDFQLGADVKLDIDATGSPLDLNIKNP